MTEIKKPTTRRTRDEYRVLSCSRPRKIVAAFEPGDLITFREAGRRTKWTITIEQAFKIALRCSANMGIFFVPIRKRRRESYVSKYP